MHLSDENRYQSIESFFGSHIKTDNQQESNAHDSQAFRTSKSGEDLTNHSAKNNNEDLFRSHLWPNQWHNNDVKIAQRFVNHYHENIYPILISNQQLLLKRQQQSKSSLSSPNPKMTVVIPKILHFIWLGPNRLPTFPPLVTRCADIDINKSDRDQIEKSNTMDDLYYNETISSWRRHHSNQDGWTIQLWNESSIQNFHEETSSSSSAITNKIETHTCDVKDGDIISILREAYQHALKIENYGLASDIARLDILYHYGGVYIDVDYYCFDSLEEFHVCSESTNDVSISCCTSPSSFSNETSNENGHDGVCFEDNHTGKNRIEFYCGASSTGCIECNNGLIGCVPHHDLIHVIMERIVKWFQSDDSELPTESEGQVPPLNQDFNNGVHSFLDSATQESLQEATATTISQFTFGARSKAMPNPSAMDVIRYTGPGQLSKLLLELFNDDGANTPRTSTSNLALENIAIMPAIVFHPLPNSKRHIWKCLVDHQDDHSRSYGSTMNNAESESFESVLDQYIDLNDTKAMHLWNCSWQHD